MGKHNIRMYSFRLFLSQIALGKYHHQPLDCISLRVSKVICVSVPKSCCFKEKYCISTGKTRQSMNAFFLLPFLFIICDARNFMSNPQLCYQSGQQDTGGIVFWGFVILSATCTWALLDPTTVGRAHSGLFLLLTCWNVISVFLTPNVLLWLCLLT